MYLKIKRAALGLSQVQASEKIGISQGDYSRIESGRVTPQLKTVVKIAAAFNIEVAELLQALEEK